MPWDYHPQPKAALNGYSEVSEATRRKVQAAAQTHGYAPNMRACSLATGRAHANGHVIPVRSRHEMVNPMIADSISGASEVHSKTGYDMLLSVAADEDEDEDGAYRGFRTWGNVDSIILHGPCKNDPRIPLLNSLGLPLWLHVRSSDCPAQTLGWT